MRLQIDSVLGAQTFKLGDTASQLPSHKIRIVVCYGYLWNQGSAGPAASRAAPPGPTAAAEAGAEGNGGLRWWHVQVGQSSQFTPGRGRSCAQIVL